QSGEESSPRQTVVVRHLARTQHRLLPTVGATFLETASLVELSPLHLAVRAWFSKTVQRRVPLKITHCAPPFSSRAISASSRSSSRSSSGRSYLPVHASPSSRPERYRSLSFSVSIRLSLPFVALIRHLHSPQSTALVP